MQLKPVNVDICDTNIRLKLYRSLMSLLFRALLGFIITGLNRFSGCILFSAL